MSKEAGFVSQQRRPNKLLLLILRLILRRQCHPFRIIFSALSALNVGLHATLLLSPRTVLLLFGDAAIRTACQRTPVGAQ